MAELPAKHDEPLSPEIVAMRAKAAKFFAPRPEQEAEDIEYWRNATMEEKGEMLAGLLRFVHAAGNYPPKRTQFPGFRRIAQAKQSNGDDNDA